MATGNTKKFELKIGKTGIIILVAGMTALLCSSFLFGIDVGKNIDTYPGKIAEIPQQALALVWRPARIKMVQNAQNKPGQVQESQTAQTVPVAQTPQASANGENIDLTYYDTLTSKKGLQKADHIPDKQPAPPAKVNEAVPQGNYVIDTQKPQEKTKEIKNDKEKDKTAAVAATDKNKFVVQAASLKDKAKAAKVHKQIASLGFKSEIVKAEVKGKGVVFRVIASGFDEKAAAEKAAKKITGKTGTNCIVRKAAAQ